MITSTASDAADGLGTSSFAENVQALSALSVTTTADNGNNTDPTIGSLRAAILAANKTSGVTIEFDIPITDPGYNASAGTWTIPTNVDPPLPPITSPVVIDGTTQPGYYAHAALNPSDPPPVILIDGAGLVGNGLTLDSTSSGSVIQGLAIYDFNSGSGVAGAGIYVLSNDNTLAADWLGVYPSEGGAVLPSPNAVGLEITGGSYTNSDGLEFAIGLNNTVGLGAVLNIAPPAGSTLSAITVSGRNVISCNSGDGIQIEGDASENLIQDTFLGTNPTGTAALPNGRYGIEIDNSSFNTIGGATTDNLVLVSGNSTGGIYISGDPFNVDSQSSSVSDNLIQNTYIGTNLAGTQALANQGDGIVIDDSTANTIGGTVDRHG